MARPTELKIRVPKTLDFEYEDYKEFEGYVGKDNVSRELRAMMKNFIETQKKGEAQLDPLNQIWHDNNRIPNNKSTTLDIYLSNHKDLTKLVDNFQSTDDINTLAKIENNSKNLMNLARNKKQDLCTVNKVNKSR